MSEFWMSIRGTIIATYNFFVGDLIILFAVVAAFILGDLLIHKFHTANTIVAIVFVGIIVAGLAGSLARELASRERLKRPEGTR